VDLRLIPRPLILRLVLIRLCDVYQGSFELSVPSI